MASSHGVQPMNPVSCGLILRDWREREREREGSSYLSKDMTRKLQLRGWKERDREIDREREREMVFISQ